MPQPTDQDVIVVQEKLAELYASLTPAQQDVLDTLMAAGLSLVDDEDLSGYLLTHDPSALDEHVRTRIAELREDWRRTNPPDGAEESEQRLRWNLRPLLTWFNRSEPRPA